MRPFVQEPTKAWSIRTAPSSLIPTTFAGECGLATCGSSAPTSISWTPA